MKVYARLIGVLLSLCCAAESQAYKPKFYNIAEQAIDSDITIIASALRTEGNEILLTVSEYVVGSGPEQLRALFKIPFRGKSPGNIEGPRVVFLREEKDGLRLFGSGLQAIWPQTVPDGRQYPFAEFDLGVDFFADLCRQIRGCVDRESPTEVSSALLRMLRSSDLFVRLTALQICQHLGTLDPRKYVDVVRLGSAFALDIEMLGHSHWMVRHASLMSMLRAPRSAALRSLLRVMNGAEVGTASQNAAFVKFRRFSGETRWDEQFQRRKRNPDRELRAAAVEDMREWLDENFSRIFAEDYEMIVRALRSENIATRTAGRLWLRAATGSDFGFDQLGSREEREKALARLHEWWAIKNPRKE